MFFGKSDNGRLVSVVVLVIIGLCSIFALYLVLPVDTDLLEVGDVADSNHNREDFYMEYLDMVEAVGNDAADPTGGKLSQSVLNTPAVSATASKGDWQKQLAVMEQYYKGYGSNFTEITVNNGLIYLQESQSKFWANCRAESGSTIKSAGCFYFAASGLITNKSGVLYTVADIIMNGHSECQSGQLHYDTAKGFYVSSGTLVRVGGSLSMLQEVIDKSPLNANVKLITGAHTGLTGKIDENLLNQGTWYFLHVNDSNSAGILSQGGEHWLLLVGSDKDNYYFANNAKRSTKVAKSTVDKLKFTQIWKIEVK